VRLEAGLATHVHYVGLIMAGLCTVEWKKTKKIRTIELNIDRTG